ncbi:MAG: hypothetical protein SNJ78_00895 [Spirochaetales bacterium]
MKEFRLEQVLQWAQANSVPLDPTVQKKIETLLSPEPLENIEELLKELKSPPPYLGPGIWLRVLNSHKSGGSHV